MNVSFEFLSTTAFDVYETHLGWRVSVLDDSRYPQVTITEKTHDMSKLMAFKGSLTWSRSIARSWGRFLGCCRLGLCFLGLNLY